MGTRWARFARGWLAALFSTLIAATSHSFAGGRPGTLAVVLSLAFAGMLCVGLAGKKPSAWRLAVSVVGSQFLFHQLFSYLGDPGWSAATGHVHGAIGTVAEFAVVTGPAWHPASSNGAAGMLVAHLVAAAMTFLLLRHGERAFWALSTNARELVRQLLFPARPGPVAVDPTTAPELAGTTDIVAPRSRIRSVQHRRGPPHRRVFA